MNTKEVKWWLSRGRQLDRRIAWLEERRVREYGRLTSMVAAPDGDIVSSTKDPHKMDAYAAIVDRIARETDDLYNARIEIDEAISGLDDSRYRTLLEARYLENMTWDQIASLMFYTRQHVTRLHGIALQEVRPIIEHMISTGRASNEKTQT